MNYFLLNFHGCVCKGVNQSTKNFFMFGKLIFRTQYNSKSGKSKNKKQRKIQRTFCAYKIEVCQLIKIPEIFRSTKLEYLITNAYIFCRWNMATIYCSIFLSLQRYVLGMSYQYFSRHNNTSYQREAPCIFIWIEQCHVEFLFEMLLLLTSFKNCILTKKCTNRYFKMKSYKRLWT